AGYLEAVQAGTPPDKQEWLGGYPQVAAQLAQVLTDQERFDPLAEPLRSCGPQAGNPGRDFGDHQLLGELGRGGMGVVYKARQVSLNRIVALKMVLDDQLGSPAALQRFRNEAEAAAQLDHPNIVPIYEVGEHAGQHYFSMAFIDGGSLADCIAT